MIAYDLTIPARPDNALYKPTAGGSSASVESPLAPPGVRIRGYSEKIHGNRAWVRFPAGDLCDIAQ